MLTDELLYERYFQGDREAAEQLVHRYEEALIRYIGGYVSDYHESEDMMIETFALMFARKRPVSSDKCFKAYLYKTARNLSIRHKRKKRFPLLEIHQTEFEMTGVTSVDAELLHNEQRKELICAMEQLKEEYQEVLYLLYFEEMKYSDMSKLLDTSEGALKASYHIAVGKITGFLKERG